MASILCNKCNSGIHYHSEPNGIQYIFFEKKDWEEITDSEYNPSKEHMNTKTYPVLYRSDTIEDDFRNLLLKAWKCPNCGSVIVFDQEGRNRLTFEISAETELGKVVSEGIAFDDYLWDNITEKSLPNRKLKLQLPSLFVKVYENGIAISKNEVFSTPQYFVRYDMPKE